MPNGIPDGFPKTRRAYMALQFSKDEKKKEMRGTKTCMMILLQMKRSGWSFSIILRILYLHMNVYVYHTNMHLFNIRSMSITKTEIAYFHV